MRKSQSQSEAKKLTKEEFILKAIPALREGAYRGIHTVYSGFNQAFRDYFGADSDPVGATTAMAKAGKILVRNVRGGAMIYLPGEAPEVKSKGSAALAKMGVS